MTNEENDLIDSRVLPDEDSNGWPVTKRQAMSFPDFVAKENWRMDIVTRILIYLILLAALVEGIGGFIAWGMDK